SAVYDCTLNFRNNENPTLLGVLNGKKYHADLYVRRIPLEDIPEDDDKCSAWLHKLYQEKGWGDTEFSKQYVSVSRPGRLALCPSEKIADQRVEVGHGLSKQSGE
ncbi:AGPAT4 isoform 3, partial [Pongo abelii]